jgi:hypothetical protein
MLKIHMQDGSAKEEDLRICTDDRYNRLMIIGEKKE